MHHIKSIYFFPIILIPLVIPSPYISFAVQFILLSFLFLSHTYTNCFIFKPVYLFFLCYLLLYIISFFRSDSITSDSFSQLLKPFSFFFAFYLSSSIDWSINSLRNGFFKPLLFLGFFSILLGFVEFLGFTTPYSRVIQGRENLLGRFLGLFGTSYFASSIYLLIASILINLWLTSKSRKYLLASFIFLSSVLFTQSRTAFIAVAIYFIIFVLYLIRSSISGLKIRTRYLYALRLPLAASLIFASFLFFFSGNFSYILVGLFTHYLPNIFNQFSASSGSIGQRLSELRYVLDIDKPLFFGVGLEDAQVGSLESTYSSTTLSYRFFGLLLYFSFLFIVFFKSRQLGRCLPSSYQCSIFNGLSSYMYVLPILSFASLITDQIRLFSIFYFMFGICYSSFFVLDSNSSNDSVRA